MSILENPLIGHASNKYEEGSSESKHGNSSKNEWNLEVKEVSNFTNYSDKLNYNSVVFWFTRYHTEFHDSSFKSN